MIDLKRIRNFIKVVETGSFSKAATQLGKTKSVVSKQVSMLEEEVGAKLLLRTTRHLGLTEAGESFYGHCREIVERAEAAMEALQRHHTQPSGTLRVACPIILGTDFLASLITAFIEQYPGIDVDLIMSDEFNNIVAEGVDVAVRVGCLEDSELAYRRLHTTPTCLVATPAYLEKQGGAPESVEQLKRFSAINCTRTISPSVWRFEKDGKSHTVRVPYRITVNSAAGLLAFLLAGAGMGILTQAGMRPYLDSGELVRLLPDYHIGEIGVYALFPKQAFMPPKMSLFLDFLEEHLVRKFQ